MPLKSLIIGHGSHSVVRTSFVQRSNQFQEDLIKRENSTNILQANYGSSNVLTEFYSFGITTQVSISLSVAIAVLVAIVVFNDDVTVATVIFFTFVDDDDNDDDVNY